MTKRAPIREPEPKKLPHQEPPKSPPSRKEPPTNEPPREEPDDSGSPMKVGGGMGWCSLRIGFRRTLVSRHVVPLGDFFYRAAPHVRADPVQEFRISFSVTHSVLECRGVQFEEVER